MKCREFVLQIPCQNTVLTRENIKNVFPHDTFIIIYITQKVLDFLSKIIYQ